MATLYCPGCGHEQKYDRGIPAEFEKMSCNNCGKLTRVFDWLWIPLDQFRSLWNKTYTTGCPY